MPRIWQLRGDRASSTPGCTSTTTASSSWTAATAQRFAGLDSAVTGIEVRVTDPWQAPRGGAASSRSGSAIPYRALRLAGPERAALFGALKLEKLAMGLIIFFIMIVAAFNIVGHAHDGGGRQDPGDRHPARRWGCRPAAIGRVFLAQGAIIGAVGHGARAGGRAGRGVRGRPIGLDPDRSRRSTSSTTCRCTSSCCDVAVVVVASLADRGGRHAATRRARRRGSTPVEAIRHE